MEFTIDDLIVLEPRLTPFLGAALDRAALGKGFEVSWAVSARTTPPHLPQLRGAELVLVSPRVSGELGPQLATLLREAGALGAGAFAFECDDPAVVEHDIASAEMPVLSWSGALSDEAEAAINRLLTERRGDLYRIGSALERALADLAVNHGGVRALIRTAANASGLPLAVVNAAGQTVVSSQEDRHEKHSGDQDTNLPLIEVELPLGARLIVGPLTDSQRVTARFLVERLAESAAAAMRRDDEIRPRGSQRAEATAALLGGITYSASDQRAAALALGLDPDAVFVVAVSSTIEEPDLARSLAALGTVHPTTPSNGLHAILVAVEGHQATLSLGRRVAEVKQRWNLEHTKDSSTLALSAPAVGVASLPGAAREAWFIANLQQRAQFPRRAVSFDSIDDVGAMRLLYELRETQELRKFVAQALGTLAERDRRGTLRATLRAFLESGGSQVDASMRLGIHRNTLAYRLRRIGELVGKDVADPGSWLTLHLALRAADLLDVQSDEA